MVCVLVVWCSLQLDCCFLIPQTSFTAHFPFIAMQFPNLNCELNEGATMLAMFVPSIVGDCLDREYFSVGIVVSHAIIRPWIRDLIETEMARKVVVEQSLKRLLSVVSFPNGSQIFIQPVSTGMYRGRTLNQLYIPRPDGLDRKKKHDWHESVWQGLYPVIVSCGGEMITY